jgi:hypothetical protein
MAKQPTKKQLTSGRVSPQMILVLLLVVVLAFAGWLYYDNRQKAAIPEAFQSPTGGTAPPPLPTQLTVPSAPGQ